MLKNIYQKALALEVISHAELETLINADIAELTNYAEQIKIKFMGKEPQTCAIINARSGLCSEDCAFCAQSSHFSTGAPVYKYIELDRVEAAAKDLAAKGVERFSIVTSGLVPDDEEFQKIKESLIIIKRYGLKPDASVGCLSYEKLMELKDAGLDAYHHNLEVARSFFPQICTTHDYEDDVQTVRDSVRAGLYTCSGGIFGLGETWAHRYELAVTLRELGVHSVPMNFLNPIKGTPKEGTTVLSEEEAMRILAVFRFLLPNRSIRVCGGRSIVFSQNSAEKVLKAGASGIMVGDYLTVKGISIDEDMEYIKRSS
ncbi:biotin synthase BioB [Seleniivibrio sp.]|uniref:biotin synthase BioB n=1 Tax=Seleniivibrio sp. TaxID=2898801 RepID=UPI0025E74018|nr:biotin synthase BioB [Seleniivibrio sp.]MCD8553003.1 biotin synthase BioB [Seleniivibrio sp.]